MNKEEIDWLKEHIWEIYKYEKSFGQDSMPTYSMSIELLSKICRAFDYLQQENKQLKELYKKTCKHLFDIGNDELARYFKAQIDENNTFMVGDM